MTITHCWWRNRESGSQSCPGVTITTTAHVSMPVVLIIETAEDNEPQWNFEERLNLMPKKGDLAEVSYELVGQVLYSYPANYYIARFEGKLDSTRQSASLYDYDSIRNSGYACKIDGKRKTHLAGSDGDLSESLPPCYFTKFAIYVLRGGTSAQHTFVQRQTERLKMVHGLHLSTVDIGSIRQADVTIKQPDLVLLSDIHRLWYSDAHKAQFCDYVKRKSLLLSANEIQSHSKAQKTTQTRSSPPTTDGADGPAQPAHVEAEQENTVSRLEAELDQSGSPFPFDCRCGLEGNGRDFDDGLEAICCDNFAFIGAIYHASVKDVQVILARTQNLYVICAIYFRRTDCLLAM